MPPILSQILAALPRAPGRDASRAMERMAPGLIGGTDRALARRQAIFVFSVRILSAAIAYVSQILLARWMGHFEYGVFVSVWVWVVVLGGITNLGFSISVVRFIPEYAERGETELLRGVLLGSRLVALGLSTAVALLGAAGIHVLGDRLESHFVWPFYMALVCVPLFALTEVQDGIARPYDWMDLAIGPPYIWRPLLILGLMALAFGLGAPATAVVAMAAAIAATWLTAVLQLLVLGRRLARRVPPGPRAWRLRYWVKTSAPIFLVEGFFVLLANTDVIVLSYFRSPEEVAVYFATVKTLAIISFVYFSVAAAAAHRFAEYHAAGDRERLESLVRDAVSWTFWPSLAASVLMLLMGKPLLLLFGPEYGAGYPLMFILIVGLLGRAAVGPVERLLNMLGEQNLCALAYGATFALNLVLNVLLVPRWGLVGAAAATSIAVLTESFLLFEAARRRTGLRVGIWALARAGGSRTAMRIEPAGQAFGAPPADLEVERIPAGGLAPIAAQAAGLAAEAAEPNLFYDPAYLGPALRHLGGARVTLHTVWRRRAGQGRLVALLPLAGRRWPVPILEAWQHPFSVLGSPLVRAGEEEAAWQALLADLGKRPGARYLRLPFLGSEAAGTLAAVASRMGLGLERIGSHERAVLALDGEAGAPAPSAKRRKELGRLRRRLAERGGQSRVVAGAAEAREAARAYLALERAGWKGRRGSAMAQDEAVRRFFLEVVDGFAAEGRCRIAMLVLDGRPIASGVALLSGGTAFYVKTSYDEGEARYSPGVLVTLDLADALAREAGIGLVDSCAVAGHAMIEGLWPGRRRLDDVLLALDPAMPRARLSAMAAVERARLGAREAAKRALRRLRGRPVRPVREAAGG